MRTSLNRVSMDSFPLFFRLQGRDVLVVGGGEIAWHKANLLSRTGANIELVAPELHPSTRELVQSAGLDWHAREFIDTDVDGKVLVIAATDDVEVNRRVSECCRQRNLPVNVVDQPDLSSVIFPSIVDRSPLVIAIGSDGNAPVLVRQLRARIESLVPAAYGNLAALVGKLRAAVRERFPDLVQRRRFWDHHLQGRAAEQALSGDIAGAEQTLRTAVESGSAEIGGEVYLVGGGPGDPDLLTFRALRLMQQVDVVLYDRLIAPEVLERCRREAERIYVGKDRNPYSITQDNINEALARLAGEGKRVLRLKGGDPFIFGRGGEELEYLAGRGIPFQVVPGITAASGCAAYGGIPLTHRDYAQSVRFITGHRRDGQLNLDWSEFLRDDQTLVFYMGLNGMEIICRELVAAGKLASTPAAMIEKGTTPRQRVVVGDLETLPERVRAAELQAPTLLIIGQVVQLHERLAWFPGAVQG